MDNRDFKKLYRRLYDEVFKLDLYSQPLSLTYQGKTNFSTTYGIITTMITFALIMFVILDNLFYGDKVNSFVYQNSINSSISLPLDFSKDAGIFLTLEDENSPKSIFNFLQGNLTIQNMDSLDSNKYYPVSNSTNLTLEECSGDSFLSSELADKYKGKALCIKNTPNKIIELTNIYTSKFILTIRNKPKTFSNNSALNSNFTLRLWSTKKTFLNMSYSYVEPISIPILLSTAKEYNSYYLSLSYKKIILYSGYFNVREEYQNIFFYKDSLKPNWIDSKKTSNESEGVILFYCEMIFPISVDEIYFQKENVINSISIIAGYMFLFYSAVNLCVKKCANVKLYESIANDTFNLISPLKKKYLTESEKTLKDKLMSSEINEIILDLAVDEFYKYNQNRGINFTFWQVINYLCCCAFCKNKNQIQLEKTFNRALDELYKSIDVVNVIKCSQEIKVFKEILFDKTQREIFDHLLRPCIDVDKVISSYNSEFTSKLETEEEVHIMQKSALKDSFMQLSKQDMYNELEMKLIDLLYIDPALKKKFLNHEEKDLNSKVNFLSKLIDLKKNC